MPHARFSWIRITPAIVLRLLHSAIVSACLAATITPTFAQAPAQQSPSIEVERWTKPQSGWLYVLDPRPDAGETGGRIWLLDPETGNVMGSIRTGYHPDFALSPDGSSLFIASDIHVHVTQLAVVNTADGAASGGDLIANRLEPTLLPSYSTMAVSGDGQVVSVLVKQDPDEAQLDTFDAKTGVALTGHVHLGHCTDGQFVSYATADRLEFVCPTVKKVHLVRTDANSRALDDTYGEFPWLHKIGFAEAFPASGGQYVAVVRGDGAIFGMDMSTLSFYATAVKSHTGEHLLAAAWAIPQDGNKVFIGYPRSPGATFANAVANGFRVYDLSNWRQLGTIKTSVPFWSAAVRGDGNRLYALAPQQHTIMVIDAATMRELRTIPVGGMPALALIAP